VRRVVGFMRGLYSRGTVIGPVKRKGKSLYTHFFTFVLVIVRSEGAMRKHGNHDISNSTKYGEGSK
jgi:hypothetical protein